MKQATDLPNKCVVVLGGSSGIGFAVAEQVSTQGATIVIASSKSGTSPERGREAGRKRKGSHNRSVG
jgi:NAD(P)-dependent dehydrogenase (short-subunit alcohol dehydrogenase family)